MNPREQRLALALVAILVLGGGMLAFAQMNKWKKDIARREDALMLEKVEAEELMKQKDFWLTRQQWLAQKQPVFTSRKDADNEIYELVQKSVKEAGLTLVPPQQQPLEEQPGLKASGVMVEVAGDLEKVLRWLYKLQSPEGFISVKGMSLKPDAEDTSKVHLSNLLIRKWYRDTGSASGDKNPTPAESQ